MYGISIRPLQKDDIPSFEKWRQGFPGNVELEVPHGYEGRSVETAVATRANGDLLGALVATQCVSLDPFIRNPEAPRLETLVGLYLLTRALEYSAAACGSRDAYIAVPNLLSEYQGIVQRCGYKVTAENCKIFRRSLY